MAGISSGTGLVSGIDTASLIEQLIALERRPIEQVQVRVNNLTAQKTAYLDISAHILTLQTKMTQLSEEDFFESANVTSSNASVLAATVTGAPAPGSYSLTVNRLVRAHQIVSQGFATADETAVGGSVMTIEAGNGFIDRDTPLGFLNGQFGVSRGSIRITDRSGTSELVDLSAAVTVQDVLIAINSTEDVNVTASVDENRLVLTDNTGLTTTDLSVADVGYTTAATDLGIVGSVSASQLVGDDVNTVTVSTSLNLLNQNNGVRTKNGQNDLRIAYSGGVIDLDLSDATTIQDVLDAINDDTDNNGNLTAAIASNGVSLELTDSTGATINVRSLNGSAAALDLGLAVGVGSGGTLTGDALIPDLNSVLLRTLNGGSGIGHTVGATSLDDLNNFAGITTGTMRITDRTGATDDVVIDSSITTIGGVADAINAASVDVVAVLDGDHIILYDTTGSTTNNLQVADLSGSAASSLGIDKNVAASTLTGDSIYYIGTSTALSALNYGNGVSSVTGSDFCIWMDSNTSFDVDISSATTLQDVIDAVNNAGGNIGVDKVTASIGADNRTIELSGGKLDEHVPPVEMLNNSAAAADLGFIGQTVVGETLTGSTLIADLTVDSRMELGILVVADRDGTVDAIDLSGVQTLGELILAMETSAASVSVSVNLQGNGIDIIDTSGGTSNLIVFSSDDTASSLGISTGTVGVAADSKNGSDLDIQYLTENTALSTLNGDKGVAAGKFRIINTNGASAIVDLTQSDDTHLSDVISEINSRGIGITAAINDTGDGIVLTDSNGGIGTLEVEEYGGGTTAKDLNILGEADAASPDTINGSFEYEIDISEAESLQDVANAINASGAPVSASIINDGTSTNPYRLTLISQHTGTAGRMLLDAPESSLVFSTVQKAQDAVVLLGSGGAGSQPVLITSHENSLSNVVEGLRLDLVSASSTPVTITVSRDPDAVVSALNTFVSSYNSLRDRIDGYTSFNEETTERGVLFGEGMLQNIESRLTSFLLDSFEVAGTVTRLKQLGVSFTQTGKLTLDESVLNDQLSTNLDGVKTFFSTDTDGFAGMLEELVEGLTDEHSSTITRRTDTIESQIELFTDRMEHMAELVADKQARLTRQFAAMEMAIARMQHQGNALASFNPNIKLSN